MKVYQKGIQGENQSALHPRLASYVDTLFTRHTTFPPPQHMMGPMSVWHSIAGYPSGMVSTHFQLCASILVPETELSIRSHCGQQTKMHRMESYVIYLQAKKTSLVTNQKLHKKNQIMSFYGVIIDKHVVQINICALK